MRVFGSSISYYTGKLEAYLRYRGIGYALLPMMPHAGELLAGAGAVQAPTVQLDDGRWVADTTPILAWLDGERPQGMPSIYPTDPATRFVALLLEDYADEWLWRAAMHYRWSYPEGRRYASGVLAGEMMGEVDLPVSEKRRLVAKRQLEGFVLGDGVTDATRDHVEQGYLTALDCLEAMLTDRRFALGDRPSIVDFGLMGPMFRHFQQDPPPAEIMRSRAPGVFAWVGRMWNARASAESAGRIDTIDEPVERMLHEACETHLVQLRGNATAFGAGRSAFDQDIQGCCYRALPVSRYRVWCLENLRRAWAALDAGARARVQPLLSEPGAAVLWDAEVPLGSDYDRKGEAPFNRAINVFADGVPGA